MQLATAMPDCMDLYKKDNNSFYRKWTVL